MSISKQFLESAGNHLNKTALIVVGKETTYAELLKLVQQQANILRLNGFERGDHLMIQLQGLDFVVMMIAAADLGVVLVPMNSDATRETIEKVAVVTETRVLIALGFEATETTFTTTLKHRGKEDDPYLLITTSGSTGDPKPIVLTQKTKLARMNAFIDLYGITEDDVTLICTPLYHSMAQRVILASLLTGATLIIQQKWSAHEFARLVNTYQVTFSVPVASQFKQIAREAKELRSLRCLVSSSAVLDQETIHKVSAITDCPIHNCYGTSEIAIATNQNSRVISPSGSVGIACKDVEIRISDEGEIQVKTPLLFDGYYKKKALTDASMSDGYFKTGDLGKIDDFGYLTYLGRTKEVINVGGQKVYPEDIERVLLKDPMIEECCAVPQKDDQFGEIVAVAIVSEQTYSLKDIQKLCLNYLTDAQIPRAVFQVEDLPRTESGKLKRVAVASYFGE